MCINKNSEQVMTSNSKKNKVVFREYSQNQLVLLPTNLADCVPENHPARIINSIVDSIPTPYFYQFYQGGGAPSYHPKALLKIVIYAFLNNIYSSRKIEAALKENIFFMWLANRDIIDHTTINRFISGTLTKFVHDIFIYVTNFLIEKGVVSLENVFIDGTKIEANANKYTFVWKKSIKKYKENIKNSLEELWQYAMNISGSELSHPAVCESAELKSSDLEEIINILQNTFEGIKIDPKKKGNWNI